MGIRVVDVRSGALMRRISVNCKKGSSVPPNYPNLKKGPGIVFNDPTVSYYLNNFSADVV